MSRIIVGVDGSIRGEDAIAFAPKNWGMPQTLLTCTWPRVIIALVDAGGGVQPLGFQPVGGTR